MKLFLGFLFILMDFPMEIGPAIVEVLPDFIGYFLVMKVLESRDDPWRHGAFGLMLASVVFFAADLLDKGAVAQIVCGCASLVAEIWMLVLLHHVVRQTERLRMLFPVLVCIRVLCSLLGWIPLVGTECIIANWVLSLCFLIAAYKPMKEGR